MTELAKILAEGERTRHLNWMRDRERAEVCEGTHAGDSAIDLSGVLTLGVRVLRGSHLQHAHSEGVHIHRLVVFFLVHLRRHELRGTLNQKNHSELSVPEISTHPSRAGEMKGERRRRRTTALLLHTALRGEKEGEQKIWRKGKIKKRKGKIGLSYLAVKESSFSLQGL